MSIHLALSSSPRRGQVTGACWGSAFVVLKQYDLRDGMLFQLCLSVGIMVVAILTLAGECPMVSR